MDKKLIIKWIEQTPEPEFTEPVKRMLKYHSEKWFATTKESSERKKKQLESQLKVVNDKLTAMTVEVVDG